MKIAGYCRISVDVELDKDNTSIENQKLIIQDYVSKYFEDAELDFFVDRDCSGYTFEQRDNYLKMRRLLMNGTYKLLIVKDFSRFSRRNSRGLAELEDLRDAGLRIISIGDNVDYPTNEDWLQIQFRFLMNEIPVTETSKKVKSVVKRRQEEGNWLTAVPYGYSLNSSKNKRIKVEQAEADIVRLIFELYNKGWGYKKIANHLTEMQTLTPHASRKARKEANGEDCKYKHKTVWSIATVQTILQNDFYIGTLRQGKSTRTKINGDAKRVDESEQLVFENHHEAIIDKRTFALTQEALKKRTRYHYRGVKKNPNVYSGFLLCGDCGNPMFPMNKTDARPAYRCGEYHKRGLKACTSHHIRVDLLDTIIKSYLQMVRDNSAVMILQLESSIKDFKKSAVSSRQTVDTLEIQLEAAKNELNSYIKQKTRELLRNPDNEEVIEESFNELIDEAQNKIKGLQNHITLVREKEKTVVRVSKVAKSAIEIFDSILDKECLDKEDLELIVDKIYVYEDRVVVELKADIDSILKCTDFSETEEAANFNSGTVDIASTEIVQVSRNHSDKVYSVNVISNGDPLEIYTDADGEVIFKKYSPIGELSSITGQYADVLYRGTGLPVIVTDRDCVIACAGVSKKEVLDRRVSRTLESLMEKRENFVCAVDGERIKPIEGVDKAAAVAFPIIGGGDVSGSLILLMHENGSCPTQTETKLAQIAASFLGKQMEE